MDNLKIGIIVADIDEYKPFEETLKTYSCESYNFLSRKAHKFYIDTKSGRAEVISILCGIGKVNAATAAMHLVDIGCNLLVNYGLSGGISNISRGEMMLCNKFLEHDFDLTGIGYKPCEKPLQEYVYEFDDKIFTLAEKIVPNIKKGTAVTGDRFICDSDTREFFKEYFNAMSCDMETAAIAYVAKSAQIPFLSLRRISDDAGDDAKSAYKEMNESDDTLLSDYIIRILSAYEK